MKTIFLPIVLGLILAVNHATAKNIQSRVVGGRDTTIEQHPYQLSLEYHNEHYAGAVLIRRNIALTGAHAFLNDDSWDFRNQYRIRAGSSFRNQGGQLARIDDVRIHPQWDNSTYNNDVAVLKMCDCLDYSPSFYRIDMVAAGQFIAEGTVSTLTGYGLLSYNGNWAPVLQEVQMPVVNRQRCSEVYDAIGYWVSDAMFCAGSFTSEFDACNGDTGGPLVANGQLIGLVSWGMGCAEWGYPGVYTSIAALRPWIDTQLF